MKRAFCVVKFKTSGEGEAVPTSWIFSQNDLYWPPFTTPLKIIKAIQSQMTPQNTWKLHPIKIYKTFGEFFPNMFSIYALTVIS